VTGADHWILTPRHLPFAGALKKSAIFDYVDRRKLHALQYLVKRAIRKRTLDDWMRRLDPSEVPVCPVLTLEEALADPQLSTRRGPTGKPGAPYALDGLEDAHVPRLGEHGEEILRTLA
jgi:crotonobetainyl-CoA:carnitine CoA-transferase CaiB-like acyl-CoA transferase